MTPLEERLDVSSVEQSGIDCVGFDLGNEAIGVGEIGDEGGEHGNPGSKDEENQAGCQPGPKSHRRGGDLRISGMNGFTICKVLQGQTLFLQSTRSKQLSLHHHFMRVIGCGRGINDHHE